MDADRFEALLRSLTASPSRRSAFRLLAGLILSRPIAFGADNAAAHNKLDKCKKIDDKDKRQKCVKKAKKHNARHANEAPPPCVPESSASTCAGRCGTRTNNCGQPVTCPACPPGQDCLVNGSCARPCTEAGDCPALVCGCPTLSVDGASYCTNVAGPGFCEASQECDSTVDCPRGQYCHPTGCTDRPNPKRCNTLCTS